MRTVQLTKSLRPEVFAVFLFIIVCATIGGAVRADTEKNQVKVFVSILPQAYFVERVAGERADINVLVGPGDSPATYEPTPKQMTALSDADVLFTIGVPFENSLLSKIRGAAPDLHVVSTYGSIDRIPIDGSQHGYHDGHDHGNLDPHIWLDPKLVKVQAAVISEELTRLDRASEATYREALDSFNRELDSLYAEVESMFESTPKRKFYVFHPAFGYFANAFGLEQVAVEIEGREPGGKHLASLIESAKTDGVKTLFVQKQFRSSSVNAIANAIGAEVVELDPLAEDYMSSFKYIASKIRESFE